MAGVDIKGGRKGGKGGSDGSTLVYMGGFI